MQRLAAALSLGAIALTTWVMTSRSLESRTSPATKLGDTRVVVLPFNDLSATPAPYLADGLTDELINSLSRQTRGRLGVIARSTALAFRRRDGNAGAFARELGATHFVEGTVRVQGPTVRVNVSLARSSDGTQIWSESYDRNMGDLLAIERDVVTAIGTHVQVAVTAESGPSPAVDPKAYLDYLRGRFEWNQRTRASLFESRRIFELITKEHPSFALGWVGLADSWSVLMDHGHLSSRESWAQARTAAETAVALDPGLAEAWTSLGMIRALFEWNTAAAEEAFNRAAALNPGYSTRLHWHAILLRSEGRFAEAYENLRKARELDPLSIGIRANAAGVLLEMHRNSEGLSEAQAVVALAPAWGPGRMLLGDALAQSGREDDAEAEYRKAEAAGSPAAPAALVSFYSSKGRQDLARHELAKLTERARTSYVSPYLIAVAAASIDSDLAFRSLGQAFEERSPSLRLLRRDRRFDPIRKDARFSRLLNVLWPEATKVANSGLAPLPDLGRDRPGR